MGVEQRVDPIGLGDLGIGHRVGPPPVVGLANELEYPARHRDGNPVSSELAYERVEPFPGRLDCDKYAAARRSTSFSCSNNRFRRRSSRNSADSLVVLPGLLPASMSAWRIHFDSVIGCTPKSSVAICSMVTPSSRLRATRTTSSRNSFGYGLATVTSFQPTHQGKPTQVSPIRAADPNDAPSAGMSRWKTVRAKRSSSAKPATRVRPTPT